MERNRKFKIGDRVTANNKSDYSRMYLGKAGAIVDGQDQRHLWGVAFEECGGYGGAFGIFYSEELEPIENGFVKALRKYSKNKK